MALNNKRVIQNLRKEIAKIKTRTDAGLRDAAYFVKEKSQDITPVEFSNLVNSAYVSSGKEYAEVGYTAEYAFTVHEGVHLKFKVPGKKAKFLEITLDRHQNDILNFIADKAKI